MASLNLLADYGSDDSETTSDNNDVPDTETIKSKTENFFQASSDDSSDEDNDLHNNSAKVDCHLESLKNPFRTSDLISRTSVFSNPYKEAEDAEKGTLEKHVKFAPKLDDIKEINGRKICWNYRKGRCRFGSNCVFAHDSELLQKKQSLPDPSQFVISSPSMDKLEQKQTSEGFTTERKKATKRPHE